MTTGDGPLKHPLKALKLWDSAPPPPQGLACAGEGCSLTPSFHIFLLITKAEKTNKTSLLSCYLHVPCMFRAKSLFPTE